jgi:hypothetical protein
MSVFLIVEMVFGNMMEVKNILILRLKLLIQFGRFSLSWVFMNKEFV